MLISVICPVFNGERYIINNILKYFINATPKDKELIIVDGGSTDNTTKVIKEWAQKYPQIKLLHNPNKYVPYSLNMAIRASQGKYIARMDVHTI